MPRNPKKQNEPGRVTEEKGMENKKHIDKVMGHMLDELADSHQPDYDRILQNAQQEIRRRQAQKKRRRRRGIAVASLFVVLLAFSCAVITFDQGYAGHFRQFFTRDSGQEGEEIVDNEIDGEKQTEFVYQTIDQEELYTIPLFHNAFPQYIPSAYVVDEIQTVSVFDKIWRILITFSNVESRSSIVYEISAAEYKTTRMDLIDYEEGEMQMENINDITYAYSNVKKGRSNIVQWDKDEIFYIIYGNERPEELLKMATSVDMGEKAKKN